MSKLEIIFIDYALPAICAIILLIFFAEIILMGFDVIKFGLA